jgi:hypothetical protein
MSFEMSSIKKIALLARFRLPAGQSLIAPLIAFL